MRTDMNRKVHPTAHAALSVTAAAFESRETWRTYRCHEHHIYKETLVTGGALRAV